MARFRRLHAVSIVLVAAAACCLHWQPAHAAPRRYPAQDYSFGEWMEKMQPVLVAPRTVEDSTVPKGQPGHRKPLPFNWRQEQDFLVKLPEAAPAADASLVPGGHGLKTAAIYYMLSSGDLTPTIGELEANGWWPYDTILPGMSRDLPVVSDRNRGDTWRNKYDQLKHIGTPHWVNRARSEILQDFYTSFFFDPQHIRGAAELPGRLDAFWTDPRDGLPYRLVEKGPGYLLRDANGLYTGGRVGYLFGTYGSPNKNDPVLAEKREVPHISLWPDEQPAWHEVAGTEIPLLLPHNRAFANTDEAFMNPLPVSADAAALPKPRFADPFYVDRLRAILAPSSNSNQPEHRRAILLDDSGERAPLEQLACPLGLQLAAQYYAIATLDNQVSLRDIVDSGFWPYSTFPRQLDLSETLYSFPREIECSLFYSPGSTDHQGNPQPPAMGGRLADLLGTREWLLWRKAEILNQVHTELYFYPNREMLPVQGVDPQREDVRPRFAAFWTNPLGTDGADVQPAFSWGNEPGQLSAVNVNLLRPQFEGLHASYTQSVPLINLVQKSPDAAVNCAVVLPRRIDVGGVEQCLTLRLPAEFGGAVGQMRWIYDTATMREELVLLDIGFTLPAYTGMTQADAVKKAGHRHIQYSAAVVPVGSQVGNVHFWEKGFAGPHTARLIYDGIAPLAAQSGFERWRNATYAFASGIGGFGPGVMNQIPNFPAGVDWLAELAATTLAAAP